ncbi:MAG: 1-acyl-sn-glycerol-3-phosphate acyltransferase [Myxococcales bacterium]|nr:1-acyl-sn-glycerol-3-phosphate acyltransferase [Myxococcales bacterium]
MTVLGWIVAIVAGLAVYELLRAQVLRLVGDRFRAQAVGFVRRHRIQLESARFIDRVWIREALAQDPRIEQAIAACAKLGERSVRQLRHQVDAYVEEIAPFFSLSAYYRLGPLLAKRVVDFCFELVVEPGAFDAQLAKVPRDAVRVYVINHRANMDPLVLAYGLLRHVPMSYAVGEWALVWPLHTLFRSFGSYFVRRGEKDPLYHAVLERFVQLLAGQGAVTGFFPEGGLSRDGALRRPRTGLLEYIVGLRHDQPDQDIVFMPVGLNYDRVLEDRYLLREKDGKPPKPTVGERIGRVIEGLWWLPRLVAANLVRVATRSHRKFGYAAIRFGEPLLLSDWPGGSELHAMPPEERKVAAQGLAEELLYRRIGAVVPATPVPVLCTAMLRPGDADDGAVRVRVREVIAELRAKGAPLAFGAAFDDVRKKRDADRPAIHEAFDDALVDDEEADIVQSLASTLLERRGVLHHVLTPTGPGREPRADAADVIAYYAKSIQHHLEESIP